MTIHQAKGSGVSVVIVPDLAATRRERFNRWPSGTAAWVAWPGRRPMRTKPFPISHGKSGKH